MKVANSRTTMGGLIKIKLPSTTTSSSVDATSKALGVAPTPLLAGGGEGTADFPAVEGGGGAFALVTGGGGREGAAEVQDFHQSGRHDEDS